VPPVNSNYGMAPTMAPCKFALRSKERCCEMSFWFR
jgi:hypothetical protein